MSLNESQKLHQLALEQSDKAQQQTRQMDSQMNSLGEEKHSVLFCFKLCVHLSTRTKSTLHVLNFP